MQASMSSSLPFPRSLFPLSWATGGVEKAQSKCKEPPWFCCGPEPASPLGISLGLGYVASSLTVPSALALPSLHSPV